MGFLFLSICFFKRMISNLLSDSSSSSYTCSITSSSTCILAISSSFYLLSSILCTGFKFLGAIPIPNSPISSKSPTPSEASIVFLLSSSYCCNGCPFPIMPSLLYSMFLASNSSFLNTFLIYANNSLTCLIELSSSMSSISPSRNPYATF